MLFNLAAFVCGRTMLHWMVNARDLRLARLVSLCIGYGVWAILWLGLGLPGLWFRSLAWPIFIASLLLVKCGSLIPELENIWRDFRGIAKRPLVAAMIPALLVTLIGAIAPETAFDPLRYHLGLPGHFIGHHKVVSVEHFIFSSFPLNASMLYGFFMMISGDMLAKLFNWHLLVIIGLMVFLVTEMRNVALLAILGFLAIPMTLVHASNAFAELLLVTFELGGLACLLAARDRPGSLAPLACSGLLFGLAVGTKYQGFHALCGAGLLWLFMHRDTKRMNPGLFPLFAACCAVAVSPWLLKNWLFTMNPVHPLFSGMLLDMEDVRRVMARSEFSLKEFMGGEISIANAATPWMFLLARDRMATYPFGPLALMLMPYFFFAGGNKMRGLAAYALAFIGAWLLTTVGWGRYLVGAIPVALVVAFAGRDALNRSSSGASRLARDMLVGVAMVGGIALGIRTITALQKPYQYLVGCEGFNDYLSHTDIFRECRAASAQMHPNEKFYSYGVLLTYYATREGYADFEYDTPLIQRVVKESFTGGDIRKKMRQRGISAILYDVRGGITQAGVSELKEWLDRDIGIYQDFMRRYAKVEYIREIAGGNIDVIFYRIGNRPDRSGRLFSGKIWPHLPALELILLEGDRAYSSGNRARALRLYQQAQKEHPGYAWTYQRLMEVYRMMGRAEDSRKAGEKLRKLAG